MYRFFTHLIFRKNKNMLVYYNIIFGGKNRNNCNDLLLDFLTICRHGDLIVCCVIQSNKVVQFLPLIIIPDSRVFHLSRKVIF